MLWWDILTLDESFHQCVTRKPKSQLINQKIYSQNTHSNLPGHAKISNFEEVSSTRPYFYSLGIHLQIITLVPMESCLGSKISLISTSASKRINSQRRGLFSLRWRLGCTMFNCLRSCAEFTLVFVCRDFYSSLTGSFEGICSSSNQCFVPLCPYQQWGMWWMENQSSSF